MDDSDFIFKGLDASPVFSELSIEEKKAMSREGVICQYAQGTTVFSADHEGDAFYLVISGVLRVRLKNRKTKECHAGQIFGEVAIFDNHRRLGTIQVEEAAVLAKFDKERIFSETNLPHALRAKILMALAKQIISYLYNEIPISTRELIMKGESENIEFKASASEAHFPKILRTMAAMMNAHGGNILLGVDDAGGLVGVSLSHHKRDALVLKLNLLVRKHMGNYPATLVVIDAEIIEGLEIIRIECEPSAVPVFVTDNDKEELLIRVSRENTQLRTLRDSIQYFEKRFVTHTMTHTNISFVPPDFTNPQSPDSVS